MGGLHHTKAFDIRFLLMGAAVCNDPIVCPCSPQASPPTDLPMAVSSSVPAVCCSRMALVL